MLIGGGRFESARPQDADGLLVEDDGDGRPRFVRERVPFLEGLPAGTGPGVTETNGTADSDLLSE